MSSADFADQIKLAEVHIEKLKREVQRAPDGRAAVLLESQEELRAVLEEVHIQNEELIEAFETIEQERWRYQDLFEFAPVAYLVTDVYGVVREANRAAAAMLCTPVEFLLGKPLIVFLDRRKWRSFRTRLINWANATEAQHWETSLLVRSASASLGDLATETIEVSVIVTAVHRPDGSLTLRWLLLDVTARRQADQALTRRNRELLALNAISAAITSTLELPAIFEMLKKLLAEHLEVLAGAILFFEGDDKPPCTQYSWELPETLLQRLVTVPDDIFDELELPEPLRNLPEVRHNVLCALLAEEDRLAARWQSCLSIRLLVDGQLRVVADLFSEKPDTFEPERFMFWATLGKQVGTALQNARLFEEVRAGHERRRVLSQRLVEVHEVERRHLARELHDEIGQLLTGLKLVLEANGPGHQEALAQVNALISRVRNLSLDLRPAMLDDLGLLPALLWHLERFTSLTHVRVNFKCNGLEGRLAPEIETAAYRIVQEALTNVARHAKTDEVTVRLWANARSLYIQVDDDGAGFDIDLVRMAGASSGLVGMTERAVLLGGSLDIESIVGGGTCLTAELPLTMVAQENTEALQSDAAD